MRVRALKCLYNPDHQMGDGLETSLKCLAEDLWKQADKRPEDVNLVSVYDDYPVMVLAQLSDLGFRGRRRYAFAHRANRLARVTGQHVGRAVVGGPGGRGRRHARTRGSDRAVAGKAGERQVDEAKLAVVSGYGMVEYRYGMCANAVVLESA